MKNIVKNDTISNVVPFRIVNIGNSRPINFLDTQDSDVYKIHSDIELLKVLTSFVSKVNLREGLAEFYNWYKTYYSACVV
jgi:UDP-glucuronate 4-epimerase